MLVLINLFMLFVFINVLLHIGIPNVIGDNNYITHKIIFFTALFYFYFLLESLSKIFRKCTVNVKDLMSKSAVIAVSGILGYGLYLDLTRSNELAKYVKEVLKMSPGHQKFMISGFIMMMIIFVRCVQILINYDDIGCDY